MPLVIVGRIGRPHGVRGEVGLDGTSLTEDELRQVGRFVWRGRGQEPRDLVLAGVRPTHARMLVSFEGYDDRTQAQELVNGELLAESESLPDPGPTTAYTFQLVGLRVETEDGRLLGRLEDVIVTGAHPVYVVQGERELLVPAAPEVLKRVDLAGGRIVVALPAGLEDI